MEVKLERVYDIDGAALPIRIEGNTYLVYPTEMKTLIGELGISYEEFVSEIEKNPFELQKKIIKIMVPKIPDGAMNRALKSEILLWGRICLKKVKEDLQTNVLRIKGADVIH
jgi:hypothetical protein